jgi:hypothetical protein
MRVRIVSRGESNAWILGKIALKLKEELIKTGVEADINEEPDPQADINHHMLYLDYHTDQATSADTLMITHIDKPEKLAKIKVQLDHASLGICMSAETMTILRNYGIDTSKLCYINPAHDNTISQKKIVIGIATAVYADGRKREQLLTKIAEKINPTDFLFKIMGSGWESIITTLKEKGFNIEYYDQFEYQRYIALVPEMDYYLYMGLDEGSMGFVDALSAGVKTIVTPQGYHLDAKHGITHSFNSAAELAAIFNTLSAEKQLLTDSVKTWTWQHYALKHLEVWNYLLTRNKTASIYEDGLNSFINKTGTNNNTWKRLKIKYRIYSLTFNRFIHSSDKLGKIKRKLKG